MQGRHRQLIGRLGAQSDHARRSRWEQSLVQFQCQMFVASWTGVVRYHGPRPVNRPNHVWVCNHTSMIDYIILCAYSPFAVIMQLHPGWVGFLQTRVLNCLGCLWFNRTEVRPRSIHPFPRRLSYGCCSASLLLANIPFALMTSWVRTAYLTFSVRLTCTLHACRSAAQVTAAYHRRSAGLQGGASCQPAFCI